MNIRIGDWVRHATQKHLQGKVRKIEFHPAEDVFGVLHWVVVTRRRRFDWGAEPRFIQVVRSGGAE